MTDKVILKADFSDGRVVCREIMCDVESIAQKEYFAAAQQGFKAEYKFKQGQIAHRAEMYVGGNVAAYNGFVRIKKG